ncbi:MAG: type III pantothenate kinase [Verrucomicrobiota bacterium]|nr:type III pantothenate kinase [Verrucomicrobiota bacterium]
MKRVRKGKTAEYLLVDISNSFTKFCFSSRDQLEKSARVRTAELTARKLRELTRGRRARTLIVSSVVPKKNGELRGAAGAESTLIVGPSLDLGVGIDYPNPRSIGADRLANAAAVAELYGAPAIVVDFGTAVTFDVVSKQRDYVGGVIAPGLEAMTSFLYDRTALLPKLTLREPVKAVGRTTRAAMMSGAVHGYRGLVGEILRQICAERFARAKVRIVATGGYAELIARQLPAIEVVHPNLTLEGLRIIANRNVAPKGST